MVFAGTHGPGTVEIFFVDPNTGGVVDGLHESGRPVQPHITLRLPYTTTPSTPWVPEIKVADLNGDSVPDAVAADTSNMVVAGLLSSVDGDGVIGYSAIAFPLPPTADTALENHLRLAMPTACRASKSWL